MGKELTKEQDKKPIVVLNDVYAECPRSTDFYYPLEVILEAMQQYADQEVEKEREKNKKELSDKNYDLDKCNYAVKLAESQIEYLKSQLQQKEEEIINFAKWITACGYSIEDNLWYKEDLNVVDVNSGLSTEQLYKIIYLTHKNK